MPKGVNRSSQKNFQEGAWDVTNLRFLVDFMSVKNMTTTQVAEKLGLARQSVYYWLVKDDARISTMYEFFDKCGYTLEFSLNKTVKRKKAAADVEIYLGEELPMKEFKRLGFLAEAIEKYHINKDALSKQIGIGVTTIFYWFKNDDCFVSYIYKIAELCDMKLKITIKPKNK